MPSKPDFTISFALLCDDYRQEINGKGMIIGIYGETIGFTKSPEAFKFCACLIGTASKEFGLEIKAEFVPDAGGQKSEFQIGADIKRADPDSDESSLLFIPVKDINLRLGGEGEILVKARKKGANRWKTISKTIIEVNPNHPIVQRQLS